MNRILTSLLTIALLASCAKTEVQYEPAGEISFAPVSKLSTKAALDGTDYPADLDMYIFANAGLPEAAAPAGFTEPYFRNALFHRSSDGIFSGAPAHYWPNVKKLVFSGISASGNINAQSNAATIEYEQLKLVIEDYRPGEGGSISGGNDLMWFPTTAPLGKQAAAIPVTMQHACAWVTINIKGDGVTGATNTTWKVTEVKFSDLSKSGNVTLEKTANWTSVEKGSSVTVYGSTGGKALTKDFVDYTKKLDSNFKFSDLVVVPQSTKSLHVTYQFVSQKGGRPDGSDIVVTETKDIPLKYNDAGDPWKAGVHYTYNIIIGTKEILVSPTVDDWDPVTVPSVSL